MKYLSKEVYKQIRQWVYLYARHLDIARWQYHFENGSPEAVVEALSFYQNEDGGFGHGLEADCSNPHSHPVATDMAYGILKSLGYDDKENPMIQGIIKFIKNAEYFTEHGWYWSIPSNNNYPCEPYYQFPNAPWFPSDWPAENYINSAMFGFVLKYFDKEHEIYKKTLRAIEYRLTLMRKYKDFCSFADEWNQQSIEANDWVSMIELLEDYKLKSAEECSRLKSEFMEIVNSYAIEPVRIYIQKRIEREEISTAELDAMIDNLSSNRLWNEDGLRCEKPNDKKDYVSSVSALWWPIMGAISDLKTLKENNRLEVK